ncbi:MULTISPECIES: 16S rRNA (adenine(1518)-N(6)/adenine(1519)-N(6))-dimethyltransferase RsmA [unclassified Granulicatella]|uniref:16S rRNA (adenine(1518)-N(6)/adenine(1519)-N(6))- dimethyltransferase RsmA n=1 Tax=unclassified Granulicatella TaxID=2630493 RepID=UPI0010746E4C|nr:MULTISPECIES: 16S rRNA (adenine(1518)-N(6)/adenine(1519)-N(6))-dimethyltransferase RsmA [unclassified Granulicatella]MBF0779626.1 16S rRNA (adenine(1518)-N(6)/adenine(1519)-N(6))-dimethyltransferase RsmA [Granulicatella sp. 19428wC4_WM01]TFU96284.1 16S rRNA (adenine(1518)-N(6)/adenine(1519)-N(6))-dimethyltransferase RsmA [Granulicatella sp. WM01]
MDKSKDIATPSRTAEIIKTYGLSMKKSLGQNFLIEPNILTRIVDVANINENSCVIEVGPGIGALTERLARVAKQVIAFEIDDYLIPVLHDTLHDYSNVTIIHQDILKAPLEQIVAEMSSDVPLSVVANLPYYITTPIIMRFVESQLPIDTFVMMMQKEVAERMTAKPKTKAYGSLTIAIQYYMHATIAFIVPKTVFSPQPNVDSAILKLERREKPLVYVANEDFFFELVKASFVQRRKTLWNNLQHHYGKSEHIKEWLAKGLAQADILPTIRGEALAIEQFAKLANALWTLKEHSKSAI